MNNKTPDQQNEEESKALLKRALGPMQNIELHRDLWPQMLRRLDAQRPVRVPWFDWALAAILCGTLLFYPSAIPALLFHL